MTKKIFKGKLEKKLSKGKIRNNKWWKKKLLVRGKIEKEVGGQKLLVRGKMEKKIGGEGTFIGLIVHSHFRAKMERKNGGPWLLFTHILEAKLKKKIIKGKIKNNKWWKKNIEEG